jgi:hypothetical protein
MEPLPKNIHKADDLVVVKYGRALGLGTIVVINLHGEAVVSWESVGLHLHLLTALEVVQPSKLYKS